MEEWLFSVRGRVQGVCFRANVVNFVRDNGMNVKGHVRNLPDGSVEVRAQGSTVELECLHDYLRHGPPLARVQEVLVSKSKHLTDLDDFDVSY